MSGCQGAKQLPSASRGSVSGKQNSQNSERDGSCPSLNPQGLVHGTHSVAPSGSIFFLLSVSLFKYSRIKSIVEMTSAQAGQDLSWSLASHPTGWPCRGTS